MDYSSLDSLCVDRFILILMELLDCDALHALHQLCSFFLSKSNVLL